MIAAAWGSDNRGAPGSGPEFPAPVRRPGSGRPGSGEGPGPLVGGQRHGRLAGSGQPAPPPVRRGRRGGAAPRRSRNASDDRCRAPMKASWALPGRKPSARPPARAPLQPEAPPMATTARMSRLSNIWLLSPLVRPGFFRLGMRTASTLETYGPNFGPSRRKRYPQPHGTLHGRTPGRPGGTQERGPARRQPEGRRAPPRQGEADRPRAHRVPARRGVVPGARHAGPAPGPRHGAGGQPALHRRRGHRLRHHRRPAGLHLQPGLHRLRRGAGRGLRREDPQGDGPRRLHRGPDDRPQRRRRGPDSGGRGLAALLRGDLPPQRDVVGRHPPDQRDPRPLRRRRRLLAGHDRLHLHGAGHLAHVHHRPRRREDGDGRGRHARGAGRRHEPRHQVGRRHLRGARREGLPRRGAPPPLVPPLQQPRGAAGRAHGRRARPSGDRADRLPARRRRTSPTT